MSDNIHKIIADFKTTRWESKPYERVVALLEQDPSLSEEFVRTIVRELHSAPTFLHYAIARLPEAAFPEMVQLALDALNEGAGSESAADVIAHASFQSVQSLHPHLDRIFRLQPNWSTYYAQWPWRESGAIHLPFLKSAADETAGTNTEAALSALLETRQPEALSFVASKCGDQALYQLLSVGFEGPEHNFRKLYTDTSFHLCFSSGYFKDDSAPVHLVKRHPTWQLTTPTILTATFGGDAEGECQNCGGSLHNILSLPTIPTNLGVTNIPSLSLQTCLSCLGWEAGSLFYQHDASGSPTGLNGPNEKVKPQFPAISLLRTEVTLRPTPRRWCWQDWAISNSRENLNRIGGYPAWIQNADYLVCPRCDRRMHHLLQLDSDLPTADGGEWLWGSGGCCYVGWCDSCQVSGFQWQCT